MYSDILRNNQARPGIIQAYSELRLTLMYSEPETYSESWYIQRPGVFRT